MEFRRASSRTYFGLDVCRPDHLAPLLGFVRNELAEFGWRPNKHRTAHLGEARPDPWIGERRVNFSVELVDDLNGRFFRGTKPKKCARLVSRHELARCRDVR